MRISHASDRCVLGGILPGGGGSGAASLAWSKPSRKAGTSWGEVQSSHSPRVRVRGSGVMIPTENVRAAARGPFFSARSPANRGSQADPDRNHSRHQKTSGNPEEFLLSTSSR